MDIKTSIVAILNDKGKIIGTGFVAGENLILTCAHVVEQATAGLNEHVTIRFSDNSKAKATVEQQSFSPSYEKDVALLRVESVPQGITPLPLAPAAGSAGHDFYAYGYATVTDVQGIGGRGKIVDIVDNGCLVQLTSQEPDHGMSGGSVLDEQRRVVIGMVTKGKGLIGEDKSIRNIFTTFATSVEVIREVCPELRLTKICPYRSLDVFNEEDAPFFFGRDRVVNKLLESLKREPRFLAVLGPSGSGKSSVVRAGLIPALRHGKVPGSQKWDIVTIRPANDPFEQLANAGFINPQLGLETTVRTWLANHPSSTRLTLFIDQFEEVLVSTPELIKQKFLTGLANLLSASVEITIILTLRDDFYSSFLLNAPKLADWLEQGLVNIPSTLEQNELSAIVIKPASSVGLRFDEGLVNIIISDAAEVDHTKGIARSTILPLLEFALAQLWEKRLEGKLTADAYNDINRVAGSLTLWADREYYAFDEAERRTARRILTSLVNVGDVTQNIPNTKRVRDIDVISLDELAPKVMQKLVQSRLLVAEKNKIEIIHEALISQWQKFSDWIEEDREYLIIFDHFMESAEEWDKSGRDRGLLYRGSRLVKINKLLETQDNYLSTIGKDFLEASLKGDPILENLKRIMFEVTASLDLDRALYRTLALLSDAIGAEQATIMLLKPEDNMLYFRAGFGTAETNALSEQQQATLKVKIGEGLAGWVVKYRQSVLVDDLSQDPRWVAPKKSPHYRSSVVVPLIIGEDVIGSIAVFHCHIAFFDDNALEMVKTISSQIAIAVNNSQLYELIRDQAERLGAMLRHRQVEDKRQAAILETVSDGILVIDPNNNITFINAATENIFGIKSSQIVGTPLENFTALLSKSSHDWIHIMNSWSEKLGDCRSEGKYSEEISLDNGLVVLVNLVPTIWQNEFLGTVFSFRKLY